MEWLDVLVIVAVELVGVACLVHLWRRPATRSMVRRLGWSLMLLVPLIGPLLYGAAYEPLERQDESLQARQQPDIETSYSGPSSLR
jgi:hypothetical protein